MSSFVERIVNSRFNIFKRRKSYNDSFEDEVDYTYTRAGSGFRRDKQLMSLSNGMDIILPIFNRIGIDVASVPLRHARVDEDGNFVETIESYLNDCLTREANLDQSGRSFMQDVVMSLCDEGCIAIVPVDTIGDPFVSKSYDILSLRAGKITQWFSNKVEVNLYNEKSGEFELVTVPKRTTAIIENPLYAVMNDRNGTLQRLLAKIRLLDIIDNQTGSGKLDLIVQLPFALKGSKRQELANERKAAIEEQMADSKYGIAYIDATERVIQLNRPAENNLFLQVQELNKLLWAQLGLTEAVFNGTANEAEMLNYWSRTIEPFLGAITDGMNRTFLSKTAFTQKQRILSVRDPFRLISTENLVEMADKLTRNEVVSPNEFRTRALGLKPSNDPKSDELRNRNIAEPKVDSAAPSNETVKMKGENPNGQNTTA